MIRPLVGQWFTVADYDVLESESVTEALHLLVALAGQIDLVIANPRSAAGTADELIDYIRKTRPALRILRVTAPAPAVSPPPSRI